jgi:MinD-like ATPase involved in chromosome partitioning or flagellar assembly
MVRFSDALPAAIKIASHHLKNGMTAGSRAIIIRDMFGVIRLMLDRPLENEPGGSETSSKYGAELAAIANELDLAIGAFSPGKERVILGTSPWMTFDNVKNDIGAFDAPGLDGKLVIVDRLVMSREWLTLPSLYSGQDVPRVVFFGIKGGVGRTTALAILANHLSRQGKKILVLDLDLESPGIGTVLLPDNTDSWPKAGIVDWFVEDAVNQADVSLLKSMSAISPLSSNADIVVIPSMSGEALADYVPKLGRVYLDIPKPDGGRELFGDRLCRMINTLQELHSPDIVLIDSRAGIHEISSVVLTRLGAECLLFGLDTPQTWHAYRALFLHFHRHNDLLKNVRESFKAVAALIPSTDSPDAYVKRFRLNAYSAFVEIYDPSDAGEISAFSFDVHDDDAPHNPIPIYFQPTFSLFDPTANASALDEKRIQEAFAELLIYGDSLMIKNSI